MNAILVDDEPFALEYLDRKLRDIDEIEVVGKYVNPLVVIESIEHQEVDIVFLDIHLPEINGLELAEQIIERYPYVKIVFVTAYDEFAVNAFELNALDYLIKPVRVERLAKTITRMKQQMQTHKEPNSQADLMLHIKIGSQVLIEGEKLQWRTSKAQELFLYLFQHRWQLVHKSVLIDLLWPELDTKKALSQLYTTIYHIRNNIKKFHDHFKLQNTSEGYILQTENIIFDLEEWEKGLQFTQPLNKNTIHYYCKLMEMNSEVYLQHYDYWWAETERYRLEQLWLKTALKLADWYFDNGFLDEAIVWYENIQQRHPTFEEAYFSLMKIYNSKGMYPLVDRQFQGLTKILEKELDMVPSVPIIKWYQAWHKQVFITE